MFNAPPDFDTLRDMLLGPLDERFSGTDRWPWLVRSLADDADRLAIAAMRFSVAMLSDAVVVHDGPVFGGHRWSLPEGLLDRLTYADTVPFVSVQHPAVLAGQGPVVADPDWGRPSFEWGYKLVRDLYATRKPAAAARMLWIWTDPVNCAPWHAPELAALNARELFAAGSARPGDVVIIGRVPVERLLLSSKNAWDFALLRGAYCATDAADMAAFHERYGGVQLTTVGRDGRAEIQRSWGQLFSQRSDWRTVTGQACIDRIERDEILSVTPVCELSLDALADDEPGIAPVYLPSSP